MNSKTRRTAIVALAAAALAVVGAGAAGKIKVTVQQDKDYQFGTRRTWAWHPEQPGEVKILVAMGDPAKIKAKFDPMIRPSIEAEMAKRGFTQAPADKADFHVCYYLLVGPDVTSQYHGQFVGAIPQWGLPDFLQSTSSLTVVPQGSLIVDVASTELKAVVWRGVAAAEIDGTAKDAERQDRINRGLEEMLKKFPPKDEKKK